MNSSWRSRAVVCVLLVQFVSLAGPAAAQFTPVNPINPVTPINPLARYNSIAETEFRLSKCGELTPERKDWLLHLLELAVGPLGGASATRRLRGLRPGTQRT